MISIAPILSLALPIGWIMITTNWKKLKRTAKDAIAQRVHPSVEI